MIVARPFVAAVLAMIFATIAAAAWAPSLLIGGIPAWQILVIPAILLLTSRLAVRPWVSGRLLSLRPILGISCAAVLLILSLSAFFWLRATEFPDVGEPFDVQAYVATLPPPEQNESATLIRNAVANLKEHRKKVADRLGRPGDPKGASSQCCLGGPSL